MKYLIDANNLAGCLKIIHNKNFDQELILILKNYFFARKSIVTVVFDGCCQYGDRYRDDVLDIVYAGRHLNVGAADDKIIELVERYITKESISLVTDDIELITRAQQLGRFHRKQIEVIKATILASRIKINLNQQRVVLQEKNINPKLEDKITNELRKLWVQK